jgi:hypothetical protein
VLVAPIGARRHLNARKPVVVSARHEVVKVVFVASVAELDNVVDFERVSSCTHHVSLVIAFLR